MCLKSVPHSPRNSCSTGPWTPYPLSSILRYGSKGRELEMAQLFSSCQDFQSASPTPGTFLHVSPCVHRDGAFLHHLISLACRGARRPPSSPETSKQGQLQNRAGIQTLRHLAAEDPSVAPQIWLKCPLFHTGHSSLRGRFCLSLGKAREE